MTEEIAPSLLTLEPEASQSTVSTQPTQASQSIVPTQPTRATLSSQSHEQKVWALDGGTMVVVGHGKRRKTDPEMTVQLEFTFLYDPRVRKVGKIFKLSIR